MRRLSNGDAAASNAENLSRCRSARVRLAGALLDRLTHHVYILDITGDSYRLKASLKRRKQEGGQTAT